VAILVRALSLIGGMLQCELLYSVVRSVWGKYGAEPLDRFYGALKGAITRGVRFSWFQHQNINGRCLARVMGTLP